MRRSSPKVGAYDIAAEIIRRGATDHGARSYVVRVSHPPTVSERLQLLAARLERRPIVIMPHKCESADAWLERYGGLKEN